EWMSAGRLLRWQRDGGGSARTHATMRRRWPRPRESARPEPAGNPSAPPPEGILNRQGAESKTRAGMFVLRRPGAAGRAPVGHGTRRTCIDRTFGLQCDFAEVGLLE